MASNRRSYQAESLQDYIRIIKEENLEDYISRGEDRKYPLITAAAFRSSDHLDIQAMTEDFQNYIGNELTELQKKHFMAFSQHYGLPTNLLDFTYSPLISLYFASCGDPQEEGYIYLLNKDRMVNLTRHVEYICPGMLSRLILGEAKDSVLFDGITNVFCIHEEYVTELLYCVDYMLGDYPGNEELRMALRGAVKKIEEVGYFSIDWLDPVIRILKKRLRELDFSLTGSSRQWGSFGTVFIGAMRLLLLQCHQKGGFYLPVYFTYEPANIARRVSNQSSVLLYQLYGINSLRQNICPDAVIKIRNKEQIQKDLDHLGINERFIFNDYDHIASYIKKKHLEKAKTSDLSWEQLCRMVKNLG
ncbi:MAG: FRG domain-containing protein [Blautia sp.]|jgi:hypothetical protein